MSNLSYAAASRKINLSSKQTQSEACRGSTHLDTTPFSVGGSERRGTATGITLPDTVQFLFANFKSIYQEDFRSEKFTEKEVEPRAARALAKPPPSAFLSDEDSPKAAVEDDCIAILTYARNPFMEFRRSMAEMVEVRLERGEKVDWDFLEELLFRYLDLNNEKAHRNVLRAFVDLVVVLNENEWRFPEQRRGGNRDGDI